jgi:hypothetical protein
VAQISEGGQPLSISMPMGANYPIQTMRIVDVAAAQREDLINEQAGGSPWRFGINMPVSLNVLTQGERQVLPNGDKLYRLGIYSKDAMTINLTFSQYRLPRGAKLFIYNKAQTDIIGAFTKSNNQDDEQLGTTLLRGDEIVLEYFEPAQVEFAAKLTVGTVTHGYRDVFNYAKAFGSSGSCNVNVNCAQAADWQCEKRSVVMLVVGGSGFCTGALINNTSQDRTPYVLTANHCGTTGVSTWVFWFNWESATCTNPSTSPAYQSMSGATLRANNAGSDVSLVQINGSVPANYNASFAGWSREGVPVSAAYGIHHPAGDIKKFSIAANSTISSTYGSAACWRVGQWTLGVTEPGSSGSPLFDPNHRIIGQLYGGPSFCGASAASLNDYYGKFDVSWSAGTTASSRLKEWLDPLNLNPTTLNTLCGITSTCAAPSTPSVSGLTNTSATINWTAVNGATAYRVEYKTAAATTWTSLTNTSNTSQSLTGLTLGTAYNVRVYSICGSETSLASTIANFTTSGGTACTDSHEPNNSFAQARSITPNSIINGTINLSGDLDYYVFTTTAAAPNIMIDLGSLNADFDISLYNSNQTLLTSSTRSSNSRDVIFYNTTTAGTYYIYVRGYNNATSNDCYRLTLITDASAQSCPSAADSPNIKQ